MLKMPRPQKGNKNKNNNMKQIMRLHTQNINYVLVFSLKEGDSLFAISESHLSTYLCTPRLMMSGLLSPDTGYFRLFSLFSSLRASARLCLKKKKFLENFSVAGACSFHGADFCHNDKEAAVNTRRIYKAFAKVRAKIRPSKPMRVRISSAKDSIHPF